MNQLISKFPPDNLIVECDAINDQVYVILQNKFLPRKMKEDGEKADVCGFISKNKSNKIINCLNIADNSNLHTADKFVEPAPYWIS